MEDRTVHSSIKDGCLEEINSQIRKAVDESIRISTNVYLDYHGKQEQVDRVCNDAYKKILGVVGLFTEQHLKEIAEETGNL